MPDGVVRTMTAKREPGPRTVVRFAGDSGDGMQILGAEFAKAVALEHHDLLTFPDFPAEIRAPAGSTFGVSAFQIQFGSDGVLTPGDEVDVLLAFNPAALKTNLYTLKQGGLIVVDEGAFSDRNLKRADYAANPLDDGSLDGYRVMPIDMTHLVAEAVAPTGVGKKQSGRAKNFWALGLCYWLFGGNRKPTIDWIETKFAKLPDVVASNVAALNAGHIYGEALELDAGDSALGSKGELHHGIFRTITGTEAMGLGLAAVAALSGQKLTYCSYPITPASALLHFLAGLNGRGITTFQAEDEIAAITAAIGASYAGALGISASSGPGIALKAEALGLAVAAELPLIVVDVQRSGPSTGMPTKPEQADLNLALYGRHGEAPLPILAPATPVECFGIMIEAARIAMTHMTPVIVLSDAYIANAAEPWELPNVDELPSIEPVFRTDPQGFEPFARDPETLARPWAKPGTPGLAHRLGGIERASGSGHISYDPDNHQQMSDLRAEKVQRVANDGLPHEIDSGMHEGDVLIIGWGSTYGAIEDAVSRVCRAGYAVGHLHLRQLWPLPPNLGAILKRFKEVVVAELNQGQLVRLIRSEFLVDAHAINQINGHPFKVSTIEAALLRLFEQRKAQFG
ncbi:MAG: 2-oxoacid:acceptor oxidoreductase subunit alpha [Gammaproteobacteria bacterium]|nr:2-oxoacid:acceptor oxidoreductase subunit alpha [Gammaproteobacteria bacterium]